MVTNKQKIAEQGYDRVTPHPLVLLFGPEDYLAGRAATRLRTVLKKKSPELEINEIDASDYSQGQLLTAASPSLFAEPRLLVVDNMEKATDGFLDELLHYIEMPAEETTLQLRHRGGVRGKKALAAIRSLGSDGVEVSCPDLKRDSDRQQFVLSEFKRAQRGITPQAARILLTAFTSDLAGLAAACQQLIADTEGDIDEEVVNRYYADRAEVSAFQVLDAALAAEPRQALIMLRQSIASGVDPIPIAAVIASKIRTMALIAYSKETGHDSGLKMPDWLRDRAARDLRGWNDAGIARVITATAEVDAGLKGGSRQPLYLLERLIELIAAKGQQQ